MSRLRAATRPAALGLALVLLAACGSDGGSPAAARTADELPARLDNGARKVKDPDDEVHEDPGRACRGSIHPTDRSLVVRVLPDGPRAPDGKLAFRSGVCVYLPPGYDGDANRYPVLYLLHGAGGNAADAVAHGIRGVMDERIRQDPDAAMIVVMPDGDGSIWNDQVDGSIRNETYVAGYVVPFVDRHFRTIPKRSARAVTGVSNGGYGAMLLATKHPDLFGAAGGMSSNIDWYGAGGLGDPGDETYRDNHPINLVDRLAHTDVVLQIASRCTSRAPIDRCDTQGLDQTFLDANRLFAARAEQTPGRAGAFEYREEDGSHRWRTWIPWLTHTQLPFFAEHLDDPR
jgi:S-formylglutathione hydrolase FrmB